MNFYDKINELINKESNFIYNSSDEHKYVKDSIIYELRNSKEFYFSVAFITNEGLAQLKLTLNELIKRGLKGKIITTNFDNFTEPKALKELLKMPNIETRMFYLEPSNPYAKGYHTKGYIFKKFDNSYSIIIGSSNLTKPALIRNEERNQKIEGNKDDDLTISNILNQFNKMWEQSRPLDEIIDKYEETYNKLKIKNKLFPLLATNEAPKPNVMQQNHIKSLNELIAKGEKRALLISATGTGKTYASAFGIKYIQGLNVNKMLYIVHRENILISAKNTFEKVFEGKIKTAILSGNNKNIDGANFIFATSQYLQRDDILSTFNKNEFDFIIYDEAHRLGKNNKNLNIINYFTPKFLLGMSATPDRTVYKSIDDDFDIYGLFNNNITYEIRLENALEAHMLVPFNYYGISDLNVDDKDIKLDNFIKLTSNERVKHILENISFFGSDGERTKGLMFVNTIKVGKELSKKLNDHGLKTIFLSSDNSSPSNREKYIKLLEKDNISDNNYLDYILTVDIFNEGIDIPSINQVVFLRPTKSSIIFLQQLGRGLRLHDGKKFLTVIDFIGNYDNNYKIIKALKNKHSTIKVPPEIIGGTSTIEFDTISKERIFKSLDNAKINSKRYI